MKDFEFQPDRDGNVTLADAVFQALGAASVCWDSEGVFQSDKAEAIGNALLAFIQEHAE